MKGRRFEEMIGKWYEGDTERYDASAAALEAKVLVDSFKGDQELADKHYAEGRRDVVYWQDIVDAETILPGMQETGHAVIVEHLGYLPSDGVRLEFEPLIRVLIKNRDSGVLTHEEFVEQITTQLKSLRNEDMVECAWCNTPTERDLERYETELIPFKHVARERLSGFLGYQPNVEYSWKAELMLRELMASDKGNHSANRTQADIRCVTIVKYTELCFTEGTAAANNLPLLGQITQYISR